MVEIKKILAISAVAGGGVQIQRLDGATPPNPIGGKITLNVEEWRRVQDLLILDLKAQNAAFEANRDGGTDDGTEIIWKP